MEQIFNFFLTSAYADTQAAQASQGGGLSFALMLAILFLFVYFAILRPQTKRAKEQQTLLGSLAKGDEVITAGGMLGRISKLTDQYIVLTIANNVDIIMQKSTVVNVLPKGTLKSIE
ncbi:MAG: preprotein translocase subunit YajC [Gammaproteobacteria bacterium RIFCSPHIGHO2_12_FULL_43_28]|nr:MAG: preprotein translocase subunit YajC [Gammaproteobacteria bacterium RIFCSPHIGHO2_12_FULL_43_28]